MHPALVDGYDRMLPVLRAEERLSLIADVAAGVGSMVDEQREQLMRELAEQAHAGRPAAVRPRDKSALARTLGATGIGMRVVERGS